MTKFCDMKPRKISHRGARAKGLNFEREVANILKSIFPNARRLLEYQVEEANGVDIQNTEPYFFQCKKYFDYVPVSRITEIQCDRLLGEVPVLVTAGNNKEAMAVLPFADLVAILQKLEGVKNG